MIKLKVGKRQGIGRRYIAGAIGGLAALAAMDLFQAVWINASVRLTGAAPDGKPARGKTFWQIGYQSQGGKGDNDANELAATGLANRLLKRDLSFDERQWAGPALHYVGGTLACGLYGVLAKSAPDNPIASGLKLGAIAWLLQDEIAVPLSGLADGPTAYPAGLHLYGLLGHLVFGVALEATRGFALGDLASGLKSGQADGDVVGQEGGFHLSVPYGSSRLMSATSLTWSMSMAD